MIDDTRALAARLIAASPFAMSLEEALKQKRERRDALLATPPIPEPDITPEPLPVIDAVAQYARDFWKDKKAADEPTAPAAKPTRRAPRKKSQSPAQQRGPFRVITGGKGGDKVK